MDSLVYLCLLIIVRYSYFWLYIIASDFRKKGVDTKKETKIV